MSQPNAGLRPLPPTFNVEFERKEAKALLRELRAGDANAVTRARARQSVFDTSKLSELQLSAAQLVIAREYGFTSWPRLVQYFEAAERQRLSDPHGVHAPDLCEQEVRALIGSHRNRRPRAARMLSSFVPRYYGRTRDDVFAIPIEEADARLAVARSCCCANWDALIERATLEAIRTANERDVNPWLLAGKAMEALDLRALIDLVAAYPTLLNPGRVAAANGARLMNSAVRYERAHGRSAMRPIIEWLESNGLNLQHELNLQLCGHLRMMTDGVQYLLDRGADPNWIAPNGLPVIEHALLRYWNGDAVDVLAKVAAQRDALWIAAGLGDVDGVAKFLDRRGKPTAAARKSRPDFTSVGPLGNGSIPDPDDEELLTETLWIAAMNGRTNVIEYLASRGAPIDSVAWEMPLLYVAVGNGWTSVVECLVRCGASVNLRGTGSGSSTPRDLALEMLETQPPSEDRRRIAELCAT